MKRIYLFISLFCFVAIVQAQNQMLRWALPGKQINFGITGTSPAVQTLLPNAAYVASNAATDENGNLLFYIINRSLYTSAGSLVGNFNSVSGYTIVEPEIAIVPVPTQCKKFYIIFCSNDGASLVEHHWLTYAIIDASGANPVISTQTTQLLYSITGSATACSGFAVSKLVTGNKRFLYYVADLGSGTIVTRFDITSSAINNQTSLVTTSTSGVSTSPFVAEGAQVNLSPDGTKLAWVSANHSEVNFLNLNATTGALVSASYKSINSGSGACYGVEWNALSTIAYISHNTGLRRVTYAGLVEATIASSSIYNNTHLEMGRDGKIYAVNNTGSGLGVINTSLHTVAASPLVITLNGKDNSNTFYTLPDQIDGEDYRYMFDPPSPNCSFRINSTVLSPTTPFNVCASENIIMNNILYSSNATEFRISVYNSTSGGGIGSLATSTLWINIGSLGASVNLEDLPGSQPNDTWLSNHAGYFIVRLEMRNFCNEVGYYDGLIQISAVPNFSLITTSGTYVAPTPPPNQVCGSILTINGSTTTCESQYWIGIWETDASANRTYQYEWGKWFTGQAPTNINLQALAANCHTGGYWINGPSSRWDNLLFGGNLAVAPFTARYYRVELCTGEPSWVCQTMLIRVDGNCRVAGSQILNSNESNSVIRVSPNPAKEVINVTMDSGEKIQSFNLIDISGRVVSSSTNPEIINNSFSIDLSGFKNGIYFLHIIDTRGEKSFTKISVQK